MHADGFPQSRSARLSPRTSLYLLSPEEVSSFFAPDDTLSCPLQRPRTLPRAHRHPRKAGFVADPSHKH